MGCPFYILSEGGGREVVALALARDRKRVDALSRPTRKKFMQLFAADAGAPAADFLKLENYLFLILLARHYNARGCFSLIALGLFYKLLDCFID